VTIQVQLSGDVNQLFAALKGFADFRHRFRTTALRKMAQVHKQQIRKRLLVTKSGPDGESWPDWKPDSRKARERKGTAGQGLLVDKRKLVNSFHAAFTVGQGKLGSALPYAAAQHFGTRRGIPARPYAGVGQTDIPELTRTLNEWVTANLPFNK
jgi:phage virion morphogenesis protein